MLPTRDFYTPPRKCAGFRFTQQYFKHYLPFLCRIHKVVKTKANNMKPTIQSI
jgi:hypothetical protein